MILCPPKKHHHHTFPFQTSHPSNPSTTKTISKITTYPKISQKTKQPKRKSLPKNRWFPGGFPWIDGSMVHLGLAAAMTTSGNSATSAFKRSFSPLIPGKVMGEGYGERFGKTPQKLTEIPKNDDLEQESKRLHVGSKTCWERTWWFWKLHEVNQWMVNATRFWFS